MKGPFVKRRRVESFVLRYAQGMVVVVVAVVAVEVEVRMRMRRRRMMMMRMMPWYDMQLIWI